MITIYTIGHSSRPLDHFLSLLRHCEIEVLVDVRSAPYSKHAPQFRKRTLQQAVEAQGVTYVYLGKELGGMPPAPDADFQVGLSLLLKLAEEKRVAIMCAEEDPARCHRSSRIAPVLKELGMAVIHVRGGAVDHVRRIGGLRRAGPEAGRQGR